MFCVVRGTLQRTGPLCWQGCAWTMPRRATRLLQRASPDLPRKTTRRRLPWLRVFSAASIKTLT